MPSTSMTASCALRNDTLHVLLFEGGKVPVPSSMQMRELPELGLQIVLTTGEEDNCLYAVAVVEATRHVPQAALKQLAAELVVSELPGEPGSFVFPLFPGSVDVGRRRVEVSLPGGGAVELLLASSGKVVAFIVPDARRRLPPAFLAAEDS